MTLKLFGEGCDKGVDRSEFKRTLLCCYIRGEGHKVAQLNSSLCRSQPGRWRRLGSYKGVSLFSLCKLYCRRLFLLLLSLPHSPLLPPPPIRLSQILTLLGDYVLGELHPHRNTFPSGAPLPIEGALEVGDEILKKRSPAAWHDSRSPRSPDPNGGSRGS